jgi:hypothetical protein
MAKVKIYRMQDKKRENFKREAKVNYQKKKKKKKKAKNQFPICLPLTTKTYNI